MIKSIFFVFLTVTFISVSYVPSIAQKKSKTKVIPPDITPRTPTMVAIDTPPPPPFAFNVSEVKFGSQGVGVESCMYVTITNITPAAQTITQLFTDDEINYSIPSPAHQMLPISIQPASNLKISVCFKPQMPTEYKAHLVLKTAQDSALMPLLGKGIKPEDVSKLPKTNFTVIQSKKTKGDWTLKLQLVTPAKITLQLLDDLGNIKTSFLKADFKNEGLYEIPFDGFDDKKQKLPAGNYYLRCLIEETARASATMKFTKVITIK